MAAKKIQDFDLEKFRFVPLKEIMEKTSFSRKSLERYNRDGTIQLKKFKGKVGCFESELKRFILAEIE